MNIYQGIILFCQICQVNAEADFYESSNILVFWEKDIKTARYFLVYIIFRGVNEFYE
jgi:hypothetical protein